MTASMSTLPLPAPKEPPQPWGTHFFDTLRLFSPRTWWGIAKNVEMSDFVNIDWNCLSQGLRGLLLPLITVLVVQQLQGSFSSGLVKCYMVSPWAFHCLFLSICKPFHELTLAGLQQHRFRSLPLPEAVESLREMVEQSRAIRKRRYDIYLPPKSTAKAEHNAKDKREPRFSLSSSKLQKTIFFLPGSAVSHVSYATIAARLSDAGYVVVVASMEPFRLALPHLGAEVSSIHRILRGVERELGKPCHFVFAGHSLGSFAAMRLAWHFYQKQQLCDPNKTYDRFSSKLIMWATIYLPNYASNLQSTPLQLLLIQGENDILLDMTKEGKDDLMAKLPPLCKQVIIPGGTHEGFASYPSNLPSDKPGKKALSRVAQQQLACRETLQFLAAKK